MVKDGNKRAMIMLMMMIKNEGAGEDNDDGYKEAVDSGDEVNKVT